jgi:hypothetical protein
MSGSDLDCSTFKCIGWRRKMKRMSRRRRMRKKRMGKGEEEKV